MGKKKKKDDEEEKLKITPIGILTALCLEYGIEISHLSPKMFKHFFDDFMEDMVRHGYAEKMD